MIELNFLKWKVDFDNKKEKHKKKMAKETS